MIRLFKHYIPVSLLLLALLESAMLLGALYIGVSVWSWWQNYQIDASYHPLFLNALLFFLIQFSAMTAMGLYQRRLSDDIRDWLLRITMSFGAGSLFVFAVFSIMPGVTPGWEVVWASVVASFVGVVIFRIGFFVLADRTLLNRRVLVLGSGEMAQQIERLRRRSDHRGCTLVGYVHLSGEHNCVSEEKIIQKKTTLVKLSEQNFIDEIVVAIKDRRKTLPVDELLECKMRGIDIIDSATFFERQTGKVRLDMLSPSWMIFSDGFRAGSVKSVLKRLFDLGVSLFLLALVWPIMLATAIAIFIESKGNGSIFYRQIRVGEMGRPFGVIKFRSMCMDAEKNGAQWATKNDSRITRVGKFIRKTRIDELPQLYNVLKGEMSFVGPRPERPEFVEQLSEKIPYYNERHMVKPGVTGWAQICYPYGASEDDSREKLQFDLYYVKNYSLFLDFTVLFQTAEVILWGKGAR